MKLINVEVITPSKPIFKGEVVSITIPGTLGGFQVLYNHAPLLSSFEIGKVKIQEQNGAQSVIYATGGGKVEVLNNKVLILSESFERVDEIDVDRAERAKERAEHRLSEKDKKEVDVARAEVALKKALNRLKIIKN